MGRVGQRRVRPRAAACLDGHIRARCHRVRHHLSCVRSKQWDSATYRFSRAFFYLAHGNLLDTGNWDPRLSIYPLNGALLYVFPAIYRFSPKWMSLVTYMAWIFTGLSVYVAARSLRTSRTGSVVAAWLCCMSPSILAQATSTNDELLAAVPILLGLVFAREFWLTSLRRYAMLAGIGIGLGLGTKLHWVFYSVFLGATAIVTTVRAVRSAEFRSRMVRRLPTLIVASIVAASLSTPFMVSNYISSGRITITEFNNLVLNQPFRLSLALEKIRVNTAELFLSPIPDLVPPVDREQRRAAYIAFNRFFMDCCFSDLVETVELSHPGGYVFQGPANPDGYLFYEYTWLGFCRTCCCSSARPMLCSGSSRLPAWCAPSRFFVGMPPPPCRLGIRADRSTTASLPCSPLRDSVQHGMPPGMRDGQPAVSCWCVS